MNTIPLVDSERATQNRVVNLLHDYCGYQYLGYKQDVDNFPIIPEILRKFIIGTVVKRIKLYNELIANAI